MSSVEASYDLWKRNGKNTHSPPQKTVIHLIEIHQKNPSTKRCFKFQHPTSIKKANMKDPSSDRNSPFSPSTKNFVPPFDPHPPCRFPHDLGPLCFPCDFACQLSEQLLNLCWKLGRIPHHLHGRFAWWKKYKKMFQVDARKILGDFPRRILEISVNLQILRFFWEVIEIRPWCLGEGCISKWKRSGDVRKACRYLDFLHQWGIKATPRAIEQADGGTLDP